MKTNEHGYPVFTLTTKHGDLNVTVNDKTPEKDSRGYDAENHPILLIGEIRINGVDITVSAWFKVYRIHGTGELSAMSSYGIKRAGTFGADVTEAARKTVNKYAVEAYNMVTDEMWTEARRANLRGRIARLRSKADDLRAEAKKADADADKIESELRVKEYNHSGRDILFNE